MEHNGAGLVNAQIFTQYQPFNTILIMSKKVDISKLSHEELLEIAAQKQAKDEEKAKMQQAIEAFTARKNAFLEKALAKFEEYHAALAELKASMIEEGEAMKDVVYSLHSAKKREQNTFTMWNTAQTIKYELEQASTVRYGEGAAAGISIIREVVESLSTKKNRVLLGMLNAVLSKNNKGEFDPKLTARLNKVKDSIKDPELFKKFQNGLDIIRDSEIVMDSQKYVRMYAKDPETGKMNAVTIQFSSL